MARSCNPGKRDGNSRTSSALPPPCANECLPEERASRHGVGRSPEAPPASFRTQIRFLLANSGRVNDFRGMEFSHVTAVAKANIYFDGKVVSHSIVFADGTKKTLGLIYPGTYHFGTDAAERMEITDGACEVVLDGTTEAVSRSAGTHFDVAAKSGFTITVKDGICQYVCSFLKS